MQRHCDTVDATESINELHAIVARLELEVQIWCLKTNDIRCAWEQLQLALLRDGPVKMVSCDHEANSQFHSSLNKMTMEMAISSQKIVQLNGRRIRELEMQLNNREHIIRILENQVMKYQDLKYHQTLCHVDWIQNLYCMRHIDDNSIHWLHDMLQCAFSIIVRSQCVAVQLREELGVALHRLSDMEYRRDVYENSPSILNYVLEMRCDCMFAAAFETRMQYDRMRCNAESNELGVKLKNALKLIEDAQLCAEYWKRVSIDALDRLERLERQISTPFNTKSPSNHEIGPWNYDSVLSFLCLIIDQKHVQSIELHSKIEWLIAIASNAQHFAKRFARDRRELLEIIPLNRIFCEDLFVQTDRIPDAFVATLNCREFDVEIIRDDLFDSYHETRRLKRALNASQNVNRTLELDVESREMFLFKSSNQLNTSNIQWSQDSFVKMQWVSLEMSIFRERERKLIETIKQTKRLCEEKLNMKNQQCDVHQSEFKRKMNETIGRIKRDKQREISELRQSFDDDIRKMKDEFRIQMELRTQEWDRESMIKSQQNERKFERIHSQLEMDFKHRLDDEIVLHRLEAQREIAIIKRRLEFEKNESISRMESEIEAKLRIQMNNELMLHTRSYDETQSKMAALKRELDCQRSSHEELTLQMENVQRQNDELRQQLYDAQQSADQATKRFASLLAVRQFKQNLQETRDDDTIDDETRRERHDVQ